MRNRCCEGPEDFFGCWPSSQLGYLECPGENITSTCNSTSFANDDMINWKQFTSLDVSTVSRGWKYFIVFPPKTSPYETLFHGGDEQEMYVDFYVSYNKWKADFYPTMEDSEAVTFWE